MSKIVRSTFIGTGASLSVNPSATTTYFVRAEGSCNSTSCVSVTITLFDLTLNTGSVPATGSNNNGSAWVVVTGGTPPYTYLWNDPLMQTNDTAVNLADGNYTVIVTDGNGCVDSASVTVHRITDLISPANPVILHVYPNPFEEVLHMYVELKILKPVTFTFYNTLGEVVIHLSADLTYGFKKIFATRHFAAGVYLLKADIGGLVIVRRFVKN